MHLAVFEETAPTQEEWLIILLLNSLSDGDYDWLRKDLLGFMMNLKITIISDDIIECIETEYLETIKAQEGNAAMAARAKLTSKCTHKPKCTLCKGRCHTVEKCWDKGGGHKGSAHDWWKQQKEGK
jgi:hypothetical protein